MKARVEIPINKLPDYIGKTVFVYDEERKTEDEVLIRGIERGWIIGRNKTKKATVRFLSNYEGQKIFAEK